jgi:hypothetical protein
MRVRLLALTSCWIGFACGPEYPDGHVIDRPRLLAVRLEPPQATIGDAVSVDTLVAYPAGADPAGAVGLWQCPADAYFPHGCAGAEGAIEIGGASGSVTVGEDWRARATAAFPYHSYLIVTATLETEGDSETAIKRLVVGLPDEDDPPNENPILESLRVDGTGGDVRLEPVIAEGSQETYVLRTIDGDVVDTTEEMFVSWYASCGTLGASLTRGTSLATSFHTDEPCTVWAILRDGRGGTDWVSVEVPTR